MKSSRLLTAYFSPTGTTQKIAHTVAEGIAYPNQDIDLSIPQKMEEISEDTVLLAVVPVYGGRVPAVALKQKQVDELERISGYTAEEAKNYLLKQLEEDVTHESAMKIKEIEARFKDEADTRAREIISLSLIHI